MTRRALLIGSQTYGLTAVPSDVERVAAALAERGFEVERCAGEDATRAGILAAYRRLIAASSGGDAALVYYSGHGAWSADVADPGPVQFLVPVDFEASTEREFRGIAAPELSALLGELTARTRNATMVLDCCFASRMVRGPGPTVKALAAPPSAKVAGHLAMLRASGARLGGPDVESNPHAVRLVACGPDQPAYEHTMADGRRTGMLTDSFLAALGEAAGLRISWAVLGRRVRERVMARFPEQRPEIEGPIRRALFEVEELEQARALPYYRERGLHWLRGGRLLGVSEGDEYAVMPLESLGTDAARRLATAVVVDVVGDRSRVALDRPGGHIPEGAPAFPLRSAAPRRPVSLEPGSEGGAARRLLEECLRASTCLRLGADAEPPVGRIRPIGSGIEVLDGGGDPLAPPLSADAWGAHEAIRRLELVARAQAMRELEGERAVAFGLEWGRVMGGAPRPLPWAGAYLSAGERIYVRLSNESAVRLYASVFDVGVAGRVALLNRSQPSGIGLGPGEVEVLGRRPGGALEGLRLEWPGDVPRTGARLESLVVIISSAPQDLRALETEGYRSAPAAASFHAVKHLSFWLSQGPHDSNQQ